MGSERRVNQRLLDYWEEKRGSRLFPEEKDLNPEDLEDLWDNCFLIQVRPASRGYRFRYSFMGEQLIDTYGDDLTGRDVYDALISMENDPILEELQQVVDEKKPLVQEAEFENVHHVVVKFRRGLFPLGPNEDTVNYILGGIRWMVD